MKKERLILSVILCLSFSIFGQTEKGNFYIGGGSDFRFYKIENGSKSDYSSYDSSQKSNSSGFAMNLKGGYFLTDRFLLGVSLPISYTKSDASNINYTEVGLFSFRVGPFVRRYLEGEKWKFFLEAGVGFGSQERPKFYYDGTYKSSVFQYNGGLGVALFLNRKVSLDFMLNYNYYSSKDVDDNSSNSMDISKGIQSEIGLSIYL
jgi:outer membrane protein